VTDIITRAEWHARAPKGAYTSLRSTKGVKVHYTGGRIDKGILNDHDLCVSLVRGIQNMHMDGNGWLDIGYSVVACPHRKVFIGRGPKHLPAANGAGLNTNHYAILALVGNSGLVEPTDNQLLSIWDAITYLREHGGAGKEIKGHRDGYATECPGDHLYAWLKKGAPRPGGAAPAKPASAKPGVHTTIVRLGSSNVELVKDLQRLLNAHGWNLVVDGIFGPATLHAVRVFQSHHGLAVDGIVGPLTWAALAKS
jgi:hypothetical protein